MCPTLKNYFSSPESNKCNQYEYCSQALKYYINVPCGDILAGIFKYIMKVQINIYQWAFFMLCKTVLAWTRIILSSKHGGKSHSQLLWPIFRIAVFSGYAVSFMLLIWCGMKWNIGGIVHSSVFYAFRQTYLKNVEALSESVKLKLYSENISLNTSNK